MKVSKRGLMEIAAHEGIVLSAYRDSVGVWTIGIGHTAAAGGLDPRDFVGEELTVGQVMELFERDIEKYAARVRRAFSRPLTQSQFDAAVSFDYNTGGILRASWVRQFNNGNEAAARRAFMNWKKPAEIIPRRRKERDLFFSGTYSGKGKVNIYPASRSGRVLWSRGRRIDMSALFGKDRTLPAIKAVPKARQETAQKAKTLSGPGPASRSQGRLANLPQTIAVGGAGIIVALVTWWDAIRHWFGELF